MSTVPHINAPFCVCDQCRPDLARNDDTPKSGSCHACGRSIPFDGPNDPPDRLVRHRNPRTFEWCSASGTTTAMVSND